MEHVAPSHEKDANVLDLKVPKPHLTSTAEGEDDSVVLSDHASVTSLLSSAHSRRLEISRRKSVQPAGLGDAVSGDAVVVPGPGKDGLPKLATILSVGHGEGDEAAFETTFEPAFETDCGTSGETASGTAVETADGTEPAEAGNDEEEDAPAPRLGEIWQSGSGDGCGGFNGNVGGHVHRSGGIRAVGAAAAAAAAAVASEDDGEEDLNHAEFREQLADIDASWDLVSSLEYIAEGAMCRVFKGNFGSRKVAIKIPLENGPETAENDLIVEMGILRHLRHPNIIELVAGGMASNGQRYIAVELLADTLSGRSAKILTRMAVPTVVNYAMQLASALEYMHDRAVYGCTVMHRDLKPDNIAFDHMDRVKLFDFGLAKVIRRKYRTKSAAYHMTGETGSLRFMAPEVCRSEPYNEKADVYSYGLIVWQMLMNRLPYEGMGHAAFFRNIIDGKQRPSTLKEWPVDLAKLLEATWDHDMDHRPSMREVCAVLKQVAAVMALEKSSGGDWSLKGLLRNAADNANG